MLSIQIDTENSTTSNYPFLRAICKDVFNLVQFMDAVWLLETFKVLSLFGWFFII